MGLNTHNRHAAVREMSPRFRQAIVRRTVAYYRYDTPGQLHLLNAIYQKLRLYTNFFQPVMKLRQKVRTGSKLTRRYDTPQTPYSRLLGHPLVAQEVKDSLTQL